MKNIIPKEKDLRTVHKNLISLIGPRPICFASTIDKDGNSNLAPYSFFNVFSAKPPILVFFVLSLSSVFGVAWWNKCLHLSSSMKLYLG